MSPQDDEGPPDDGAGRVARMVSSFKAVNRDLALLEAGGTAMNVSEPIPIYGIGQPQSDSQPSNLLDRVHRVGWRYLVFEGNDMHVADIKPDASDRPELIRSPKLVQQIVKTGRFAEAVADSTHYNIRLLDLSILGQSVLWLASKKGGDPDRFFALSPEARELNAGDFLKQMSAAERQKAAAYASTSDESGG
jgi:hypothetical protein